MKKVLLGALLLLSTLGFGQTRINKVFPTFKETSNNLKNFFEYQYSEYDGKWNEHKPIIRGLEFKTVLIDSNKYYIFMIYDIDGAYKYPTIKRDFISWKIIRGIIFTPEQYKELMSYNEVESNFERVEVDAISDDGLKDMIVSVTNTIENHKSSYNPSLRIKKEGDKIRFILPLKSEWRLLEGKDYWNFDKHYYETSVTDFNRLFNLK